RAYKERTRQEFAKLSTTISEIDCRRAENDDGRYENRNHDFFLKPVFASCNQALSSLPINAPSDLEGMLLASALITLGIGNIRNPSRYGYCPGRSEPGGVVSARLKEMILTVCCQYDNILSIRQ